MYSSDHSPAGRRQDEVPQRETQGGPRVLVASATGYLGGHVARALHNAGYQVRALARDPVRLAPVADACDEVVIGQATEIASLDGVCDGVEAVFSSIGTRSFAPRPSFWDVDYHANMNLLLQARRAGVRQFIFVSVLHGDEVRHRAPVAEARERVVDALQRSGLTWTVLRPTGFFNDMAAIFRLARHGLNVIVGDGQSRVNPIHGADLAEEIVRGLHDPSRHNRALDVGGPDTYTFRALGELAGEAIGRRVHTISIPPALIGAASAAAAPLNANAAALLKTAQLLGNTDAVGTPVGHHHLRDLFHELAACS